MNPRIWGPLTWDIIHNLKIRHKNNKNFIIFMLHFSNILPCSMCKKHMKKIIINGYKNQINPLHLNIKSQQDFFIWTYNFHHCVNLHKNKYNKSPNINLIFNHYNNTKNNNLKNIQTFLKISSSFINNTNIFSYNFFILNYNKYLDIK